MKDLSFDNDIREIVKSVAKSENINKYEVSEVETNGKGAGYLGKIFMVTITDKLSEKKLHILLKLAFKDEKLREYVPIQESFENEVYFYTTIYPALEEFRESTNCPKEYDLVPKCYKSSLNTQMESLVMENLKCQGFELFDKTLDLTSEHVELIFKYYGYYHALSFALRDQNFEKFSKLGSPIKNIFIRFTNQGSFCDNLRSGLSEVLKGLIPGKHDELISKVDMYLKQCKELFLDCVKSDVEYPVINHGDCWSNNMLFKNDKSGKPVDLRLLDWQIVKIGSPVCDLAYALYTGASKPILDKLDDYLKIYHDSLSSTIRKLGSDPKKLFTFKALKEQWRIYSKFGLFMATMVLKVKYTDYEDVKDLQDVDFDKIDEGENVVVDGNYDKEKFGKKMFEVISHMNEIDAL